MPWFEINGIGTILHVTHSIVTNFFQAFCYRRESGKCCICYDPHQDGVSAPASGGSYGLGTSGDATGATVLAQIGNDCTGITTIGATGSGLGDYLEIPAMHNVGIEWLQCT